MVTTDPIADLSLEIKNAAKIINIKIILSIFLGFNIIYLNITAIPIITCI